MPQLYITQLPIFNEILYFSKSQVTYNNYYNSVEIEMKIVRVHDIK